MLLVQSLDKFPTAANTSRTADSISFSPTGAGPAGVKVIITGRQFDDLQDMRLGGKSLL